MKNLLGRSYFINCRFVVHFCLDLVSLVDGSPYLRILIICTTFQIQILRCSIIFCSESQAYVVKHVRYMIQSVEGHRPNDCIFVCSMNIYYYLRRDKRVCSVQSVHWIWCFGAGLPASMPRLVDPLIGSASLLSPKTAGGRHSLSLVAELAPQVANKTADGNSLTYHVKTTSSVI